VDQANTLRRIMNLVHVTREKVSFAWSVGGL